MRTAFQEINIYAPNINNDDSLNLIGAFPITDNCERNATLMGDDYVRLVFQSSIYVELPAFSFIRLSGEQADSVQTFFLMSDYRPSSDGSEKSGDIIHADSYSYDVKFYSVANMLRKPVCYRHVKVAKELPETGFYEWDEPELTVSADLPTMYVIIMQSIEQYASRLDDSYMFQQMLSTLPANGLANVLGVIQPSENVKLTQATKLSTFNFDGANIADVCTGVANQFTEEKRETEWYIVETAAEEGYVNELIMHFCKCEDLDHSISAVSDFSWENTSSDRDIYPITTGGLSKVEYSRDISNIPQVIVPFGAERNMTYEAVKGIDIVSQMQSTFGKRVRLDPNTTYDVYKLLPDGTREEKTITTDAHGGLANTDVNTGVERVEFFDDVYPQCHFRVTQVDTRIKRKDGSDIPEYTITAVAIDTEGEVVEPSAGFYPIQIEEGATLSVRFESGYLNGREFEIANKTKKDPNSGEYSLKFTIVADGSVEDGTLIPSGNFIPRAYVQGGYEGDKFALFNMKMPSVYIDYAKQELAQAAYEKLLEYQETLPDMKCTSMPRDFHGVTVEFGKRFKVNSEKIGFRMQLVQHSGGSGSGHGIGGLTPVVILPTKVPIDFISRVINYSYKLTKPDDVQFTLSSAIARGTLSEMASAITSVTNVTGGLGQTARNLSRRGWRDASEVADMIDSITSEMMLVGNEKYQFTYSFDVECQDSQGGTSGDFSKLHFTYGQLQHTQEPYIGWHSGLWEVGEADYNTDEYGAALVDDTPYYVYAVCEDASTTATIKLSSVSSSAEPDMLIGILSSVYDGKRVFSRTNGFTAIEGGTITTEQIQDAGRNLIIDFSSNPPRIIARNSAEIYGNIRFKSFTDDSGNNPFNIGGENLYTKQDPIEFGHPIVYLETGIVLESGETYIVSIQSADSSEYTLKVSEKIGSETTDLGELSYPNELSVLITGHGGTLVFRHGYGLYRINKYYGIMVQKGVTPTQYQPTYRYLAQALEHDATKEVTSVNGGLLLSSLIKLSQGGVVRAGMSGLADYSQTNNGVTLWGGGDYADALAQAEVDVDYSSLTNVLPVLLTKTGFGSVIGCFSVVDSDTIKVENNSGNKIYITTKSIAQLVPSTNTLTFDVDGNEQTAYAGTYTITINGGTVIVNCSAQGRTTKKSGGLYIQGTCQFTAALYMKIGTEETLLASSDTLLQWSQSQTSWSSKSTTITLNVTGSISSKVLDSNQVCQLYLDLNASGNDNIRYESITKGTVTGVSSRMVIIDRRTIIGSDGMALMIDSDHVFYVYNNASDLDVRMSGLPTSNTGITSQKGRLYTSNGYIRIVT